MKLDLKEWIAKVSKGITAKVWTFSNEAADTTYAANAYVGFPTASTSNFDNSTITYSGGILTFHKKGTFIVNAHVPIFTTTNGRGFVKLVNYGTGLTLAQSITYGTFVTATITKVLPVSNGTQIGVQCAEALRTNAGGIGPAYIQVTEVGG